MCGSVRAARTRSSRPAARSARWRRPWISRSCCRSTSSARCDAEIIGRIRIMRSPFTAALVLTLALVLAAPPPARADEPMDQLKAQVDRVLKLIDDPSLKDKPKDKRVAVR